jgi:hypothetical protein
MRGAVESFEARQAYEIIAGTIIGFAIPFPDAGTGVVVCSFPIGN